VKEGSTGIAMLLENPRAQQDTLMPLCGKDASGKLLMSSKAYIEGRLQVKPCPGEIGCLSFKLVIEGVLRSKEADKRRMPDPAEFALALEALLTDKEDDMTDSWADFE
jgi:hypothetical protein